MDKEKIIAETLENDLIDKIVAKTEQLILDSIPCKPENTNPKYLRRHIERYIYPNGMGIYHYDNSPFLMLWPLNFFKDGNIITAARSYLVLNGEIIGHQQKNPDSILPMPTHCIFERRQIGKAQDKI